MEPRLKTHLTQLILAHMFLWITCVYKRPRRSPLITPTPGFATCVASIPAASSICPSITDRQRTPITTAGDHSSNVRTVILGRGCVVRLSGNVLVPFSWYGLARRNEHITLLYMHCMITIIKCDN